MSHRTYLLVVARSAARHVARKVGAAAATRAKQVHDEHAVVLGVDVRRDVVLAQQVLDGGADLGHVVARVDALADDDAQLRHALRLRLRNDLVDLGERLLNVQAVHINRARRRVGIVRGINPVDRLRVEHLHLLLVVVALVAELLRPRVVAVAVRGLGLVKALGHLVALRARAVAQFLVLRVLRIDVVVVERVDIVRAENRLRVGRGAAHDARAWARTVRGALRIAAALCIAAALRVAAALAPAALRHARAHASAHARARGRLELAPLQRTQELCERTALTLRPMRKNKRRFDLTNRRISSILSPGAPRRSVEKKRGARRAYAFIVYTPPPVCATRRLGAAAALPGRQQTGVVSVPFPWPCCAVS